MFCFIYLLFFSFFCLVSLIELGSLNAAECQQTHNVAKTSLQRRCNVTTLQRRCNDVVATLCVCWDNTFAVLLYGVYLVPVKSLFRFFVLVLWVLDPV